MKFLKTHILFLSAYVGSGDYEEYYEYDDYDDPDKDPDESISSSLSTSTSTTPGTTITQHSSTYDQYPTTSLQSETHPHRHHHGEIRPIDDTEPSIQVAREPDLEKIHTEPTSTSEFEETEIYFSPEYTSPETSSTPLQTPATTTSTTTAATTTASTTTTTTSTTTTTTTTPSTPITEVSETKPEIVTPVSGLYKPSETLETDDEYDDYDEGDDEEAITEVPFTRNEVSLSENEREPILPEIITDTETTPVEVITMKSKTDPIEFEFDTIPTVKTTEDIRTTSVATEETVPSVTTTEMPLPISTVSTTSSITEKITTLEEEESTTIKHTTVRHTVSSTTTQKATTPQVTESIEYEVKNFPPTIQIRLNRIAVTAGKHFSKLVPEDMFTDMEDGNNLKLEFLDKDENPVNKSSWCQFNLKKREIYGL